MGWAAVGRHGGLQKQQAHQRCPWPLGWAAPLQAVRGAGWRRGAQQAWACNSCNALPCKRHRCTSDQQPGCQRFLLGVSPTTLPIVFPAPQVFSSPPTRAPGRRPRRTLPAPTGAPHLKIPRSRGTAYRALSSSVRPAVSCTLPVTTSEMLKVVSRSSVISVGAPAGGRAGGTSGCCCGDSAGQRMLCSFSLRAAAGWQALCDRSLCRRASRRRPRGNWAAALALSCRQQASTKAVTPSRQQQSRVLGCRPPPPAHQARQVGAWYPRGTPTVPRSPMTTSST